MNLKCRLLSLLRTHPPDCQHCNAREAYGNEMRKRLEELNWRTEAHSLNDGDHREVGEVFESRPSDVVATQPISLKARQGKKIA